MMGLHDDRASAVAAGDDDRVLAIDRVRARETDAWELRRVRAAAGVALKIDPLLDELLAVIDRVEVLCESGGDLTPSPGHQAISDLAQLRSDLRAVADRIRGPWRTVAIPAVIRLAGVER